MREYHIGIDWGGTRIKLGAVTLEGEFLRQMIYQTPKVDDITTVVEELIHKTDELVQAVDGKLAGIGLGLTGPVNPERGVVYLPGKQKGLENYPLVPQFAEHFSVPVTAENDGKVALFAEQFSGKAKNVDWACVLTIGTGVGSGVVVGGQVLSDPNFMFGTQVGHLVMDLGDQPLCLTGARGTAEMFCSATALIIAVCSGLRRGIRSTLSEQYFKDPQSIDFQTIIEDGVMQNDRLCCDELSRWCVKLGVLIVNAIHAYSSQIVILSGGATLGAKYFLPQVQKHVDQYLFRYPSDEKVPVVISDIQEHSGVLGAAVMSMRHTRS